MMISSPLLLLIYLEVLCSNFFHSHFPRRHRVSQGQSLHYGEGVHPQVQELLEEDVLLDAGAKGGQGRGQLQEGQRLSQ